MASIDISMKEGYNCFGYIKCVCKLKEWSFESMKIDFGNKNWLNDDICYAYSYRFEETPVFVQKDGYVENQQYGNGIYDYDNISLLTKKKYSAGNKASIRCSFENLGAPLIVIADKMYTDKRGVLRYGDYLEIVLYKNGVNVWKMWMEDEKFLGKNSSVLNSQFPRVIVIHSVQKLRPTV